MSEQERLRIEKDAGKYVDQYNHLSCKSDCYIAGAIHEHEILKPQLEYADSIIKKLSEALVTRDGNITNNILLDKLKNERNMAIDECIKKVFEYKHIIFLADTFVNELKSLKK